MRLSALAKLNKHKTELTAVIATELKMHPDSNTKPPTHSLCHPHTYTNTQTLLYSTAYPPYRHHVAIKPPMGTIMLAYKQM